MEYVCVRILRESLTLFVVLHHINSISVILWRWYDVWDEEKVQAYTFTDSKDLYPPTPYRHGMRRTGLWWHWKLYTAQLNVIAMTGIRSSVPRVTYPAIQPTRLTPHSRGVPGSAKPMVGSAFSRKFAVRLQLTFRWAKICTLYCSSLINPSRDTYYTVSPAMVVWTNGCL